MYNVDRSASGRIRRLKARTLASYHSLNPTVNAFGGKAQSGETLLLQNVGTVINCTECVQVPEVPACNPPSLDTIATYLRNYMTEFRNSNFWAYNCDGDGYYIYDGGEDMYDGANFTTPWLLSGETFVTDADEGDPNILENYPYAISYENVTQTIVDSDFNYVSLGYVQTTNTDPDNEDNPQPDTSRHPLTVMGFRCSGPVGWQIGGNTGADGEDGIILSAELYTGQTINGFTVYTGYRQIYDANDPTICNLVLLLGHPSWSSVFGTVGIYSDESTTNSNGFYYYAGSGSENILAIHTVLSKPLGDDTTPIPDSELQTVVANLTQRIAESLGL